MGKIEIDRSFVMAAVVLTFFVLACWKVSAENITMRGYYPSPSGNYMDLSVVNNMGIGTVTVANNLTVAKNVGINTTDLTKAALWVMGNVGVGTISAPRTLQVYGNVGIGTDLIVNNNVGIGTPIAFRELEVAGNMSVGTTLTVPHFGWFDVYINTPVSWRPDNALHQMDSQIYGMYVAGNTILGSGTQDRTYVNDTLVVVRNIELWNGAVILRPIDTAVAGIPSGQEGKIYISKGPPAKLMMFLNGSWHVPLTKLCPVCAIVGSSCPATCPDGSIYP